MPIKIIPQEFPLIVIYPIVFFMPWRSDRSLYAATGHRAREDRRGGAPPLEGAGQTGPPLRWFSRRENTVILLGIPKGFVPSKKISKNEEFTENGAEHAGKHTGIYHDWSPYQWGSWEVEHHVAQLWEDLIQSFTTYFSLIHGPLGPSLVRCSSSCGDAAFLFGPNIPTHGGFSHFIAGWWFGCHFLFSH